MSGKASSKSKVEKKTKVSSSSKESKTVSMEKSIKRKASADTASADLAPKAMKKQKTSVAKETTYSEPTKNTKGEIVFQGHPDFRPNMTPKEVLQAGSFGGTYFRPIKSSITGEKYSGVWKELPKHWLEGLDIQRQVASSTYRETVNTYKVKCGGSLEMWETSGWIIKQDPYGWFQWYCRFYQGRRTADDERQIGRWSRCASLTGRWRNNLITKVYNSGCAYDNSAVSPVVRQTLQHWGYKLTKDDYEKVQKESPSDNKKSNHRFDWTLNIFLYVYMYQSKVYFHSSEIIFQILSLSKL
ncbi:uncharacterized protein [Ptychodera flava]|uniref:uncharacterized protein n=1 Tax=Ptychodera flava TaxID=63121 RepID=UPI00396AAFEC